MENCDYVKIRGLLLSWKDGEISFIGIMKELEKMNGS